MAIKKGSDDHFTKFIFSENGNVTVRRLHRIHVQANDGRLHVLRGENLPTMIHVSTGEGHKGAHLGQILLKPKKIRLTKSLHLRLDDPCAGLYRVGWFLLGMLAFMLIQFMFTAH